MIYNVRECYKKTKQTKKEFPTTSKHDKYFILVEWKKKSLNSLMRFYSLPSRMCKLSIYDHSITPSFALS